MERISEAVYPIDLKQKRIAAGLTQTALAEEWGVARETIVRVENGKQSISFPLAIRGALDFGSLTLRVGDQTFSLHANEATGPTSKDRYDDPNDEQLNDLDIAEHISNVRNQAADVVDAANRLERRWLAIRNGCPKAEQEFAHYYAEAFELKWAVDGVIEDGLKDRPAVVERGREIARERRPGLRVEDESAA